MARENNSLDVEKAKKAEELHQEISSIINNAVGWEYQPGNLELLEKLLHAVEEVGFLLSRLGLIENYDRPSGLSRESNNRVNRVLEVVFELIMTDQEEK